MPPKEDPQAGQFDSEWGTKKAQKLITAMNENKQARTDYEDANKEFRELFRSYVTDTGLKAGDRVRMGKYVTKVTASAGGGTETKKWSSLGRGQITLLE